MYVKEGHPRTARRQLEEIVGSLSGPVRISDPYYGVRTLDTLELLPHTTQVKFLTAKTNENSTKLAGPLADFRRERANVEIRIVAAANVLHDRYILTPDLLMIIGHGLKDIGNKESFLIVVDRSVAPDLIEELIASFENRWTTATPL